MGEEDFEKERNIIRRKNIGLLGQFAAGAIPLILVKVLLVNREAIPQWGFRLLALLGYLACWYLLFEFTYRRWARINYPDELNPVKRFVNRFYNNKLATFGLFLIMTMAVIAIFADEIARYPYDYDPAWMEFSELPPCKEHICGTMPLGEDLFSEIVYGAKISLFIGVGVTALTTIIGLLMGVTAGYFGGWVDKVLNYITDVVMAFPFLVLVLVLVGVLRTNPMLESTFESMGQVMGLDVRLAVAFFVLAILGWTTIFRIVRAKVLSLRELGYIEAAKAVGASPGKIIFRHLIPNCLAPVIIVATLSIGSVILTEAALSYLGMGAEIGTPTWGKLLSDANSYVSQPPYFALVFFPGLMIFLTVLGFTTMGDGLRDAIDPRMKV